jgi:hypothetical protein
MKYATKKAAGNAPTFIAYQVRERAGETGFFTRIGAAWPNKDGKGFHILLESIPLDGKIILRLREDQDEQSTGIAAALSEVFAA